MASEQPASADSPDRIWTLEGLVDGGLPEVPTLEATPAAPWVEVESDPDTIPDRVVVEPAWDDMSVGRARSGRELWVAWDGRPRYHATLHGPVPAGARFLPLLEVEGHDEIQFLLVEPGAPDGVVLQWYRETASRAFRLSVAPAPGVRAEGLADTVALRYLRTCPGVMDTCGLFGTSAKVAAAEDPVTPPGGWFVHWETAMHDVRPDAVWEPVITHEGHDGARLEFEATPYDGDAGGAYSPDNPALVHRAWLVHAGRRIHAFDLVSVRLDGFERAGVTRDGGRLVAWVWRPDYARLTFSEHHLETGRRLGEPSETWAEPYFEVGCGALIHGTRPMPVRTPDGLAVALYWGNDTALLFDRNVERGRHVSTGIATETLEPWGDDLPDVLHLDPAVASIVP